MASRVVETLFIVSTFIAIVGAITSIVLIYQLGDKAISKGLLYWIGSCLTPLFAVLVYDFIENKKRKKYY